jgi:hypothetical protein
MKLLHIVYEENFPAIDLSNAIAIYEANVIKSALFVVIHTRLLVLRVTRCSHFQLLVRLFNSLTVVGKLA